MPMCLLPLPALSPGEEGIIRQINGPEGLRRRLTDLGFTPDAAVECLFRSAWSDPTAYRIRDTVIALRQEDAVHVIVRRTEEA